MVAINKDEKMAKGTVKDVVCPACFKLLPYPTIVRQQADRYGRGLRTYFGWCFKCERGFEVIQFARDGRWPIHKYQSYTIAEQTGVSLPTGKWIVLNDLPEPAAIVIGPGGGYDNQIDINQMTLNVLGTLQKALKAITATVESLLKAVGDKHV